MNQSNLKTVFYVVVAVVVVALLVLFVSGSATPANQNSPANTSTVRQTPVPDKVTIEKSKQEILALVSANRVLTQSEKEMMVQALIGEKITYYGFTEAEIQKILSVLNKK